MNKDYKSMELDERHDALEIQDILGELTGARTVCTKSHKIKETIRIDYIIFILIILSTFL